MGSLLLRGANVVRLACSFIKKSCDITFRIVALIAATASHKATPTGIHVQEPVKCAICDKVIVNASKGVPGDDALQCEGTSGGWMHRCCAGVSLSHYSSLSVSEEPFYCTICCQQTMRETISSHCDTVFALNLEIAQLKADKSSLQSGRVILSPAHDENACRSDGAAPSRRSVMPPSPSTAFKTTREATTASPPIFARKNIVCLT